MASIFKGVLYSIILVNVLFGIGSGEMARVLRGDGSYWLFVIFVM